MRESASCANPRQPASQACWFQYPLDSYPSASLWARQQPSARNGSERSHLPRITLAVLGLSRTPGRQKTNRWNRWTHEVVMRRRAATWQSGALLVGLGGQASQDATHDGKKKKEIPMPSRLYPVRRLVNCAKNPLLSGMTGVIRVGLRLGLHPDLPDPCMFAAETSCTRLADRPPRIWSGGAHLPDAVKRRAQFARLAPYLLSVRIFPMSPSTARFLMSVVSSPRHAAAAHPS